MRTTISIEDDVLYAVKEIARKQHKSAGTVLSHLARKALTHPDATSDNDLVASKFGFRRIPKGGKIVSNELINNLREDEQI